jgi:hypothetical protein
MAQVNRREGRGDDTSHDDIEGSDEAAHAHHGGTTSVSFEVAHAPENRGYTS